VLLNDQAVRSCTLPLNALANGTHIKTIEGLASENGELHLVQKAWLTAQVPQCGYCQSGMIMATVALLKNNPKPSQQDIEKSIGNICRCGTYPRVVQAITDLAVTADLSQGANRG
jgi:isoquinoline 1-oxidoreductase alpha subunit